MYTHYLSSWIYKYKWDADGRPNHPPWVVRMATKDFDFSKALHLQLILGLRPANERRRYKVTLSLIGWK